MREIALDTETTGLEPKQGHRVIEIGCVEMINRIKTGKTFHAYINPERDVPEEAYKVHGISLEFLADKPVFKEVAEAFLDFVSDSPLVIHNAVFDMKFLNAELGLLKRAIMPMERAIDTLQLAKKKFPGSPVSLDALCKRFNIDISHRTKHGALLDAELLADVYVELTGGSQSVMDFTAYGKQEKTVITLQRTFREPRVFMITEEEKEAHEAFLQKIKNALWKK